MSEPNPTLHLGQADESLENEEALKAKRDAAVLKALIFLLSSLGFDNSLHADEKEYLLKLFEYFARKDHLDLEASAKIMSEAEFYRTKKTCRKGLPDPARIMQILRAKTSELALTDRTIGFHAYHSLNKVEISSPSLQRAILSYLRNLFK